MPPASVAKPGHTAPACAAAALAHCPAGDCPACQGSVPAKAPQAAKGLPVKGLSAGPSAVFGIRSMAAERRAICFATSASAARAASWSCQRSISFFARSARSIGGFCSVMLRIIGMAYASSQCSYRIAKSRAKPAMLDRQAGPVGNATGKMGMGKD
jgi:hypothetical protein